ncbi:TIGR02588 family protein [Leptolyngbya sp. DQ-M1]|uniref:TIGR02588 family protein n=1 Tax=Leptolyngbya sp. DQ-M1 TaxID=2933920 RepID=UPI003297EFFF
MPQAKRETRSPAEWITFGIASSILGTIAGLVIYVWVSDRYEPAAISIEQREIRNTNGKFYVPFEVTNTGGETVESVQVVAELKAGDRVLESGDQQIDFLSRGEKEEGAFVFQRDPRQGQLVVRVASYKIP